MTNLKSVFDVLDALRHLSEVDPETEPDDRKHLDDAIASLENITTAEKSTDEQANQEKKDLVSTSSGIADTGVLTGPIGGLKSFLMRTQRDNESK